VLCHHIAQIRVQYSLSIVFAIFHEQKGNSGDVRDSFDKAKKMRGDECCSYRRCRGRKSNSGLRLKWIPKELANGALGKMSDSYGLNRASAWTLSVKAPENSRAISATDGIERGIDEGG